MQIPTVGNYKTVNKIFREMRRYSLPAPLKCWVIIEEGDDPKSYDADEVVVVPKGFKCFAHAKARALEYARRYRLEKVRSGQLSPNYLVVQTDDDSVVSYDLIMEAFNLDVDVVIGTVKPRYTNKFGLILDYERPYTCMHTCMFFTNLQHPIFGHGESTIYTHKVESEISYEFTPLNGKALNDVPVMGNEDMYFLHKAEIAGFRIFKSDKTSEISPPLTFSDAVKQRRRWLWGNFNIVYIKRMLPFSHAIRFIFIHFFLFLYPIAKIGLLLELFNFIRLSFAEQILTSVAFVAWYAVRLYSVRQVMGWIHGIVATFVTNITTFLNFVVCAIGIIKGDPKHFDVIKKVV
ncbi:MAG: glycosyltransferase family 2 protein [Candidatus Bathyarchaeia archaeon]